MSEKEVYTLKILEKVIDKRLSLTQGTKQLNLTPRHLRRLKKAYLAGGAAALISKKRGKTNRRHSTKLKNLVLSLLQWMHEANIRQIHESKEVTLHQPRHRRSTIGELVQMDGSIHDWFEGRGPKCTLLVLIDDATSCFLQLRFVKAETTFDYFDTVKSYLIEHGKPGAFYHDQKL